MSAYTKGDWKVVEDDEIYSGSVLVAGTFQPDCWVVPSSKGTLPPVAECKANARLMSAAPDLLEALKKLLATLPQDVLIDNEDAANAAWVQAQAAVAKAEGK